MSGLSEVGSRRAMIIGDQREMIIGGWKDWLSKNRRNTISEYQLDMNIEVLKIFLS